VNTQSRTSGRIILESVSGKEVVFRAFCEQEGTRQNRTILYAKASGFSQQLLGKNAEIGPCFPTNFASPAPKKRRVKTPSPRSFIRVAPSARPHWKINQMCHWHFSLADIFTSICLVPLIVRRDINRGQGCCVAKPPELPYSSLEPTSIRWQTSD
jgi:hypothetical protein